MTDFITVKVCDYAGYKKAKALSITDPGKVKLEDHLHDMIVSVSSIDLIEESDKSENQPLLQKMKIRHGSYYIVYGSMKEFKGLLV